MSGIDKELLAQWQIEAALDPPEIFDIRKYEGEIFYWHDGKWKVWLHLSDMGLSEAFDEKCI